MQLPCGAQNLKSTDRGGETRYKHSGLVATLENSHKFVFHILHEKMLIRAFSILI